MRSHLRLLPGWPIVVGLALPLLLAAAALAAAFAFTGPQPAAAAPPPPVTEVGLPPPAGLLVQVSGAVVKPGLYRVAKGGRVYDAVAIAGGLASDADPARLPDLAARVKDGEQVKVPALRSSGTGSTRTTATVDLNSATLDELEGVPGISPGLAAAIIEYRTQFGGFATSRELVDVLGMGEADYLVAKHYVHT